MVLPNSGIVRFIRKQRGGLMSDKESRSKPTNFLEINAGNHPDNTAIIGI